MLISIAVVVAERCALGNIVVISALRSAKTKVVKSSQIRESWAAQIRKSGKFLHLLRQARIIGGLCILVIIGSRVGVIADS
jgi:hypothetical protein